jgi:2-keto-4-pentenoate hydratase/2-oxohepta-3-ene-1,7-dioic acid hydratase in catechol pathway
MQLVSFSHPQRTGVGILRDDVVTVTAWTGDLLSLLDAGVTPNETSIRYPLAELTLRPPLRPRKIIAVGRNYAEHAKELGNDAPAAPLLFAKLSSSVIAAGEPITWSESVTQQVDWEAELAVVIGKRASKVAVADAMNVVYGYTIANDVTARDLQESEPQWLRGKGMDTFCPLGPGIVTRRDIADPHALTLTTTVNGEQMQNGSTGDMIHRVDALVSYISQWVRLDPGDIILTGTPAGVGKGMKPPRFLKDGDTVSVSIDGIGTLTNPCKTTP